MGLCIDLDLFSVKPVRSIVLHFYVLLDILEVGSGSFEVTVDIHREEAEVTGEEVKAEGTSVDRLDVDLPGSVFTDIAEEVRDDTSCFTKIEQVIWNLQWAATVYYTKPTQFIFHHIESEVREPQEQPPQLFMPLEANLDIEEDEADMVAALYKKVDESSAKVKAFK